MILTNPHHQVHHWIGGRGDATVCGIRSAEVPWFTEICLFIGDPTFYVTCRRCVDRIDWKAAAREFRSELRTLGK